MKRSSQHFTRTGLACLLLVLLNTATLHAQSWGTAEGLMQAERIARVTTLCDDTLNADSLTTAWIPFGSFLQAFPDERIFGPGKFTLFLYADDSSVNVSGDMEITVQAELALEDTTRTYTQRDGSLNLIPASWPVSEPGGYALPVPVYGGGYIRFTVESSDTSTVRLDLWRTR